MEDGVDVLRLEIGQQAAGVGRREHHQLDPSTVRLGLDLGRDGQASIEGPCR